MGFRTSVKRFYTPYKFTIGIFLCLICVYILGLKQYKQIETHFNLQRLRVSQNVSKHVRHNKDWNVMNGDIKSAIIDDLNSNQDLKFKSKRKSNKSDTHLKLINNEADIQESKDHNIKNPLRVYVVEEHHEVIPYWFTAANEGRIPKKDNTLIHIDGHDDMSPVENVPGYPFFKWPSTKQFKYLMQTNDGFIQVLRVKVISIIVQASEMATGGENHTNIIDSEEAFDFECGPCKLDDKALPAKGYCSDCAEYLCDVCFNIHCRPMPSRHHILLDTDAMPKHVVRKPTVNMSTETCTKHPGKMIEYFCPSHDFLGCSACITIDHRSCNGVLYIPDEVDTFYDSEEYKAFKSSLASEETRNKDTIYVVDDAKAKSEVMLINTKQKIKSFRKNVDQFMGNIEKMLEEEAVLLDKQNSDILKVVSAECTAQAECFQSVVRKLEEQEWRKQAHATFITMKRSKQDIASYKKQFSKTRRRLYELNSFSFKPFKDSDIEKMITTFGEIESVGELSLCKTIIATVMVYDNAEKIWTTKGCSSLDLLHHKLMGAFRIVGRKLDNNKVTMNFVCLKEMKYHVASLTYHQIEDSRKAYGLNFEIKEHAQQFAKAMKKAIDILNEHKEKECIEQETREQKEQEHEEREYQERLVRLEEIAAKQPKRERNIKEIEAKRQEETRRNIDKPRDRAPPARDEGWRRGGPQADTPRGGDSAASSDRSWRPAGGRGWREREQEKNDSCKNDQEQSRSMQQCWRRGGSQVDTSRGGDSAPSFDRSWRPAGGMGWREREQEKNDSWKNDQEQRSDKCMSREESCGGARRREARDGGRVDDWRDGDTGGAGGGGWRNRVCDRGGEAISGGGEAISGGGEARKHGSEDRTSRSGDRDPSDDRGGSSRDDRGPNDGGFRRDDRGS